MHSQNLASGTDLSSVVFMIHADYFVARNWPAAIVSGFEEKLRQFNPKSQLAEIYFKYDSYLGRFGLKSDFKQEIDIDRNLLEQLGPFKRAYFAGGKATMCLYNAVATVAPHASEVVLIDDLYLDKDANDQVQYYAGYYAKKFGGCFPKTRFGVCNSPDLEDISFLK